MNNNNDTMKAVNDWTNKNIDRMTSLGELNLRIFEKLANRQINAMNLYMDHAMRVMKLAAESKGYNDFFQGQIEATKDLSERVVTEGKSTMDLLGEARDDYRIWFEKNLSEISSELQIDQPK